MDPNVLNKTSSDIRSSERAGSLLPSVLVVDDEPLNLRTLIKALYNDYDVTVATGGQEALSLIRQNGPPDLILLDIVMPDMDGYDVCRVLKSQARTADVPIIFLSALASAEAEEKGFEAGAVDFIYKPFSVAVVRSRVRTHVTIQGMMEHLDKVNGELNEKIYQLMTTDQKLLSKIEELEIISRKNQIFQSVFSSTSEGIIITNAKGFIESVNKSFTRITGYSEEEAIGARYDLLRSWRHSTAFYQQMKEDVKQHGYWTGEIFNRRKDGEVYPELRTISAIYGKNGKATHYITVFSDVSGIKKTQKQLDFLTWHDVLTHLPNRSLMLDRLETAISACHRNECASFVVILDIEGFKAVNDARGVLAGDTVLCEVASRLKSVMKDGDTTARLGADEFAMLVASHGLSKQQAAEEAYVLCERIHDLFDQAFDVEGFKIHLTCALGVALFSAEDNKTALEILNNAQTACSRRNSDVTSRGATFFDETMGDQAKESFSIEHDLRLALERQELEVFYQSQISHEGTLMGAEALVRWRHPDQGLIPPGVFIPVAEKTSLIIDPEKYVLAQVCTDLKTLSEEGHPVRISVNVCPAHFRDPGFVGEVVTQISRQGVEAHHLVIEMTEGVMVSDINLIIEKMRHLAGFGIRFSIDDFGAGYSSLMYLKKLPIHELKIDKSFVLDAPQNSSDASIVDAVVSIAHSLDLDVVAEGVETADHVAFLGRYPDVIMQGYHFDRPAPFAEWKTALQSVRS